ncbi:MOSC domain-containing protein [Mesobacillus maritimus]|uniref:MOSC domain-containing protein n=1 Tax=Mesobacillus maritimus TaxID=1643336 RepID=UPI00203CCF92|nr:MOSC domain-containing protein [Mesobacillus maritimus]MCM3585719.1 MOSC domain-containing protein [Mesobacillus maritimus]MCM3670474.1 MOSC domain-containing protein [Mesobacillus maritimus]
MSAPYVQKLLTGKVKTVGNPHASNRLDRQWESGIFKNTVDDKLWLSQKGLTGDEVADKKNHGGPEKALFAYSATHYDVWKEELDVNAIEIGAMGENIAVHFMDEHTVCIGDTYQFGDAIIQVSQPRQPCWKPARRFKVIDFALRIQQSGRTGWYFRVLKEGLVQGETELTLLDRPYPQWTIAKCNEVMHVKTDDLTLANELYACKFLAESWKQTLAKRLAGEKSSIEKRVFGPNKD